MEQETKTDWSKFRPIYRKDPNGQRTAVMIPIDPPEEVRKPYSDK